MNRLKVLYIKRHPKTRGNGTWASHIYRLRDSWYIDNLDGFFRASLMTQADVTYAGIEKLKKMAKRDLSDFDTIVFHFQCGHPIYKTPVFEILDHEVRSLSVKLSGLPKILLLANANAGDVPPDRTMDMFSLVFKREPYKDRERYPLASYNRDKLRPTVLSCNLVPVNILNFQTIDPPDYGYKEPSSQFNNDVFFAGMDTASVRRDVIEYMVHSGVHFTGGIHKKNKPVPADYRYPRLSRRRFYKTVRESRINLAIEGYGQFTYRHWELLGLAAFMISSPSVRDVQLPFEMREGEHYIAYDDLSDLTDKIDFYLKRPQERNRIAGNGRDLFEQAYNFHVHGRYIREEIEKMVRSSPSL